MPCRGRDIRSHSGCSDDDEIEKASNTTTVLIVTKRALEIQSDSKTDQSSTKSSDGTKERKR